MQTTISVAAARDRPADQALDLAVVVQVGGVDDADAGVQRAADQVERVAAVHRPVRPGQREGAQPDIGDHRAVPSESRVTQFPPSASRSPSIDRPVPVKVRSKAYSGGSAAAGFPEK